MKILYVLVACLMIMPAMAQTSARTTAAREQAAARQELEGKIIVVTDNFKIIETPTGMTLCTLDVGVANFTTYQIQQLQIFFGWDGIETFANFSGITPEKGNKVNIGLAGKICKSVTATPSLRVTKCQLKGANESVCRAAITLAE